MTQWFQKFGWIYNPADGKVTAPFGGFANYDSKETGSKFSDGNLARLITAALVDIGNWPREHIFIRSIPNDFKKTMHYLMKAEALEYQADYAHMVESMSQLLGIGASENPTAAGNVDKFTGGNASGPQLAAFASHAGFKGDALVIAVAIALAESSGVSDAMNYNSNGGTYDTGCWQINTVHTSGGTGLPAPPGGNGTLNMPKDWNAVKDSMPNNVANFVQQCQDPTFNAAEAYSISSKGTGFGPWTTYTSGAYKSHMAEAAQAVKAFRSGNTGSGPTSGDSHGDNSPQKTQWSDTSTPSGGKDGKTVGKFITFCKKALGTPYKWGGQDPFHGGADCAGFCHYMYQHYWGINIGFGTGSQIGAGNKVDKANLRPGDLVFFYPGEQGLPAGHVGIYIGDGNVIHDPHTGDVVKIAPLSSMPYVTSRRVLNDNVPMGDVSGAQTPQGQGVANDQSAAATARVAAFFQLPTVDSTTSLFLSGKRALANDIPLFEWIQQMCKGGGRRFTTMPNGDFLAFFPDYFNDFKRTPYFIVRPIEIIDLEIQVSDRSLVTHVFASGSSYMPQTTTLLDQELSMVASVQEPAFNMFINVDEQNTKTVKERKGKKKSKKKTTDELHVWKGANKFLKRYGARPLPINLPDVRNPVLLWMAAWFEFQKNWASQFGATAEFTFMPEVLPGGIINLDNKITMFVESVTHTWDMEAGFTTTAELTSPAAVNPKDKRFGGMVLAGGNFGVAQSVKDDKGIAGDAGPKGGGEP
jgi:cell wall-associated NlpC family hydrolase